MDTYRYKDEKSDKFWRIEALGKELVVNYGKTGTIGKYQIKITGQIGAKLKEMALNSMKRIEMAAEILGWSVSGEPSEIIQKMIRDLETFPVSCK